MGVKTQKRNRQDLTAHSDAGHDLDVRQSLDAKRSLTAPASDRPTHWLKNLGLLTTGGLAMLGLMTLANLGRTGGQLLTRISDLFTLEAPPAQVDIRSLVVQQVRGASELTTAVYSMESVVPTSRERTLGGYVIGKTTLLYIAHGEVRAGVDLAALQPEDVQTLGPSLTLRLPPPRVLDSKIDVNRSKVYDYDRGFMGLGPDVAPELQELAQRETLTKIVETACADGLLQSANDRAKLAVSQLLATAGYAEVSVEIQPPAVDACKVPNLVPAAPDAAPAPNPALEAIPDPSPVPEPSPAPNSAPTLPLPLPSAAPDPPAAL